MNVICLPIKCIYSFMIIRWSILMSQITIYYDFYRIDCVECMLAAHNSPVDTAAEDNRARWRCYCCCRFRLTDDVRRLVHLFPVHRSVFSLCAQDLVSNCQCIDHDKRISHSAANRKRECVRWTTIVHHSVIQRNVRDDKCRTPCSRFDDLQTWCHQRGQHNSKMTKSEC